MIFRLPSSFTTWFFSFFPLQYWAYQTHLIAAMTCFKCKSKASFIIKSKPLDTFATLPMEFAHIYYFQLLWKTLKRLDTIKWFMHGSKINLSYISFCIVFESIKTKSDWLMTVLADRSMCEWWLVPWKVTCSWGQRRKSTEGCLASATLWNMALSLTGMIWSEYGTTSTATTSCRRFQRNILCCWRRPPWTRVETGRRLQKYSLNHSMCPRSTFLCKPY